MNIKHIIKQYANISGIEFPCILNPLLLKIAEKKYNVPYRMRIHVNYYLVGEYKKGNITKQEIIEMLWKYER